MTHVWDKNIADFAAQIIPNCHRGFGECQALGFLDADGFVEAAIVYHNWQPENAVIEISAGSVNRKWLTRDRLFRIFEYPFSQLECRLVVARIGEHNARARRIWRSLGADEYIIPALRTPTEAEVIYTLSRDVWQNSKFSKDVSNGQA